MKGKNIIIGICGGIAAYKIPQLVRLLKKRGANVRVALTEEGARFVSELALATVSEEPVYRKFFRRRILRVWTIRAISLLESGLMPW